MLCSMECDNVNNIAVQKIHPEKDVLVWPIMVASLWVSIATCMDARINTPYCKFPINCHCMTRLSGLTQPWALATHIHRSKSHN